MTSEKDRRQFAKLCKLAAWDELDALIARHRTGVPSYHRIAVAELQHRRRYWHDHGPAHPIDAIRNRKRRTA